MAKALDVGQLMDNLRKGFDFKKVAAVGIHKTDGSYVVVIDKNIDDIELVYMIDALKERRERRAKGE